MQPERAGPSRNGIQPTPSSSTAQHGDDAVFRHLLLLQRLPDALVGIQPMLFPGGTNIRVG